MTPTTTAATTTKTGFGSRQSLAATLYEPHTIKPHSQHQTPMTARLLWVDDEIELLKAHILFLRKKGYDVETVSNGYDAIDRCASADFDLILLDENMPGLSGLETLQRIKDLTPATPVVMVTKSEEENIMDQAIGSKIADYLIKPVNPTQILLSLKKNIHQRELVTEHTQTAYRQNFMQLSQLIDDARSIDDWYEAYRQLVGWELQLSDADSSMLDMLAMQKGEANKAFAKFVASNYLRWIADKEAKDRPLMSPDIFKHSIKRVRSACSCSFARQCNVKRLTFEPLLLHSAFKLTESGIKGSFDISSDLVCKLSHYRSFLGGELSHLLEDSSYLALFAEILYSEFVKYFGVADLLKLSFCTFFNVPELFLHCFDLPKIIKKVLSQKGQDL